MLHVFDLSYYSDISHRADEILDAVRNGKMPCDGPWPPENVAMFERWINAGKFA